MRPGENAHADDVDILLDRRLDDHLRRLAQAGVDHLHARVAQGARDHLDAAVVPIQPRLGHENPNLASNIHSLKPHKPRELGSVRSVVPRRTGGSVLPRGGIPDTAS